MKREEEGTPCEQFSSLENEKAREGEKEKEEVPVRTWEERKREKELCTEMLPEAVEHAPRSKHHHLDYKNSVGILDPTF